MSNGNPLVTAQSILALEEESTVGTQPSFTASSGGHNIMDASMNPTGGSRRREGQSSMSQLPATRGALPGAAACRVEGYGNGASGLPGWTSLLRGCGFAEAGATFSPVSGSSSATALSMRHYLDGRIEDLVGAMGTFTITGRIGEPLDFAFEFQGVFYDNTDAALITPTYPTVVPPIFAGATFTVGGTARKVSQFAITINNEIKLREDPAATDADSDGTGYLGAVIVNRDIVLSMDPEAALYATKDWRTDFKANTEAAFNCVVGSQSNNTLTIAAPKAQLRTDPAKIDREGIVAEQLEFQCNRSAAAGDDELTIAFS